MTGEHAVIRAEERLEVGTEVIPVGRARLVVETTTEEVLVPVRVTRQRVRVETSGPPDTAAVDVERTGRTTGWLTLHGDEPVVTVRSVPTERVRLVTEWVAGEAEVTTTVSREVVEVDTQP
jgi:stress response protein YsnF